MIRIYFVLIFCAVSLISCEKENILQSNNSSSLTIGEHGDPKGGLPLANGINPPQLVWNSPEPVAGNLGPAIFYSPHQDDESLGMGASIAEHARAGRPVYVVLMTKGENTRMLDHITEYYDEDAVMSDVVTARNNEFVAACQALGVHRIYIANGGAGYTENVTTNTLVNYFKKTMIFMDNTFPVASHKTVSGNCDVYDNSCATMPAHSACATAMYDLWDSGTISDIRLYRLYNFYFTNYETPSGCSHAPDMVRTIDPLDKATRVNAFAEYSKLDPCNQRYGLGRRVSVPDLFDNIEPHDFEYLDYINNSCN